jgi:signal transduction histidine kinase
MAIAKKIVEAHEGKIDVVSEQGRSTEFIVTLPLSQ